MPIGPMVRRAFGRHERLISELWRAMFVDLDEWTRKVKEWVPNPDRILELGCGEGYSTERLVTAFPDARIDAVDIADNIGRLYSGPAERVRFRQVYAEELALVEPGAYDLIILADVLHHVPRVARESLLRSIRSLLAPGGVLLFKDWARNYTPVYYAGYCADRWLTGDRIAYLTPAEARSSLAAVFGQGCVGAETTVRPWSNNYAFRVVPQ